MREKFGGSVGNDFLKWLSKDKKFKDKSARDVVSRLQRVTRIVTLDDSYSEIEYVHYLLSRSSSFKALTPSVKSHLKRAAKLYLEFLFNYRKIHSPSLF